MICRTFGSGKYGDLIVGGSADEIAKHALATYQQVVVLKLMPMTNATQITDGERALIKRRFESGASTK